MIFTSNKETDYLILNKLDDGDLINFFKAFPENNCCRSDCQKLNQRRSSFLRRSI